MASELPTADAEVYKTKVRDCNWRRLKIKMIAVVAFGRLQPIVDEEAPKQKRVKVKQNNFSQSFRKKVRNDLVENMEQKRDAAKSRGSRWIKKIQGGDAVIPPSFNWTQCAWTFIGVMTTHSILSRLNAYIVSESDGQLALILAPFGAFSTLQYSLTAAPASQPRNAFFAQVGTRKLICNMPGS